VIEVVHHTAGVVFRGDMLTVVLTHKGVACAALDELAVDVAGSMGEVLAGF